MIRLRSTHRLSTVVIAVACVLGAATLSGPGAGAAAAATVNSSARPNGLVYRNGALYIADAGENVIRKLNLATHVETIVAGVPGPAGFSGDGGPATSAHLCSPAFLSFDGAGNLYVADRGVNRVRKVAGGIITTVAGQSTSCGFSTGSFSGDGGPATSADLDSPAGVTVDGKGNLYISDTYNHRIRKVAKATGKITTIAGSGAYGDCCVGGFSGDGGPAVLAQLYQPSDLFVDKGGNVVFADLYNSRIRKISPSGIITTVVGSAPLPSGYCDPHMEIELTASAVLCGPMGLSYNGSTVFFTDYYNNRVRKVAVLGLVVLPVAGSGPNWPSAGGYSGDGGPAILGVMNYPIDIAVDGKGNLYISDDQNHVIRKVNQLGIITTVPGFGSAG